MTNEELLKEAGFKEDNDCLVMNFSSGFSVKAFFDNEDDVVFHLYKEGQLFQATIQTSEPDDIANAFKELMSVLPVLLKIINKKSPNSVNDFRQIIQLLQSLSKY